MVQSKLWRQVQAMNLWVCFGLACLSWANCLAAPPPHIIFVMADDMGWGQTGYRGHPVLKTPNLDAMAANGLRFERFYAGSPVCSTLYRMS